MSFDPGRMVRPHITAAANYAPGASPLDDPEAVRLDFNESPFGLSPKAQAVYDTYRTGNRYPTFNQDALVEAISTYIGVDSTRVIAGAGLDDVFATLAVTIIDVGDEVVISEPTFGVYRSLFELHGASIVNVPLGPGPSFALDVDGIIDSVTDRTKLVIVCNPNNPTGTLFNKADVQRIIENVLCLVAIDEAYAEFSGVSHLDLANAFPNVILLRTLSKFAGLAGYRVGYGVFPEPLMPWIRRAAPAFYNVAALSSAVAIASLNDLDHLNGNVATLNQERDQLCGALNTIPGTTAFPSAANFLLIQVPGGDGKAIATRLAEGKVHIRSFAGALAPYIRVSIGSPQDNATFLEAYRGAIAGEGDLA